ncbi:hypothetical protein CGC54_08580 [Capnocytophaga canimorsus]|uniref:Uncharacterized protein n=1 Tax=Capnocytophaga canimorsus TaxID=28188 RepID=A0AAC9Z634_9FLAO|nr:hypothetical protein CGC54_08580 [Capnocytophaga canimorsus]
MYKSLNYRIYSPIYSVLRDFFFFVKKKERKNELTFYVINCKCVFYVFGFDSIKTNLFLSH